MNPCILSLLMLLGTMSLSTGLIVGSELQNVPPQYYCGSKLSRAMAVVCADVWENGDYEKRSGNMYGYVLRPYYEHQNLENQLRRVGSSNKGPATQNASNRKKRGVVEDCCDNTCTVETLESYC